ncbi:hypothetical protein ACP70R_022273 [Stipagrostis hirtigluma subsp. patula]
MDPANNAAGAVVAVDIENGGGDVAIGTRPCPADPRLNEPQPFTWLGAAPYLAAWLVGAVMFAVGLWLDGGWPGSTRAGIALYAIGTLLAGGAILSGGLVSELGGCAIDLPRVGPD